MEQVNVPDTSAPATVHEWDYTGDENMLGCLGLSSAFFFF